METPITPSNSPLSTPLLDRQIETPTIGQQQTSTSILENELFLDTMLKKAHYTTLNKEIIIELQKAVEGIYNSELEQVKVIQQIQTNQLKTYQVFQLRSNYAR